MQNLDWEEMTAAIRSWAEQSNITPADLADQLDYSYQHCWNLLRGSTNANAETIGRISLALGTQSLEEILQIYSQRVSSLS